MDKFEIDIPVLFIFFARPTQTELVFRQICLARPSKLYLYQDGPRVNREDDISNIEECRKIVQNINWDCELHVLFQKENIGCDPSEFIAQKWMFENEEYGIVLEDDDVPSLSFFPFCKELLEKYKNDDRINIICGMNHLGKIDAYPYSYLFTQSGSIWGWASWKRVIDDWDEKYGFLNDKHALELLKEKLGRRLFTQFLKKSIEHKISKKAHYETLLGASMHLNSRLNIVPAKNLISNVGVGNNSTHSVSTLNKVPSGIRRILFMEKYEIEIPLKHPKYVIEEFGYKKKVDRIMANGHPLIRFYRLLESLIYRIILGDLNSVISGFKRRLKLN